MTDSKIEKLKVLQDQVSICTKCDLCKTRIQTVFARGNPNSYIILVGEAAGEEEDKLGLPFVGRSGKLLDETITQLGLDPTKDIYVCNIIKCRPPGNRRPEDTEVNSCISYLEEQIQIVSPKVIIALGSTAVDSLLPANTFGITKIRGKFFKYNKVPLIPTYHPSYVLRNGSKGPVYDDFKRDLESAINKSRE
jgi:DNA polymerase